jgi:hypothetical protein
MTQEIIKKKRRKRRRRGSKKRMVNPFYSKKMDATFTTRSSWEVKFYTFLENSPDVIAYYVEYAKVPYIYNVRTKKIRNYIPDVIIQYADRKEMIEIKPNNQVNKPINVRKFSAAREYCKTLGMEFKIITETHLKEMGLL